ncbi:hypothetical protein A3862_27220 [Methylobacterium sp. XJLW]|jgi:hypothetical protein|uniref:3'-5' exoribonuclease domain-containing protein n=1 Tax=Methylobacterium sp. XJLW TaxID=739141 RepID=UPI000DAADA16|nr:3'-5' exoribonuclease [Methylobacterium sp. XJLW]AWV18775.1 hypothetical protein A3862_27220 [Methylobacterium sp. XJLW]
MRIWFDTEFLEDGRNIELISIGLVDEDGRSLYMETKEARDLADSTPWLRENVLPHLRGGGYTHTRQQIAGYLQIFAGESPEFWAYYADYDWVALCQIFGTMMGLPKGWPMFCRDLQQAIGLAGRGKPPEQTSGEHDALEDALWTRDAWTWLRDATLGGHGILVPLEGPGFKSLAPATETSGA